MVWRIDQWDVARTPWPIEDESVQCVCTSPPFWGLRDYGMENQIGLERTPEEYIEKMVAVFREVRRVLRKDGTAWLNLGDCHAGSNMTGGQNSKEYGRRADRMIPSRNTGAVPNGLKAKDLVGMPWRVAFALQQDGWWLRSDIVWAKPNPMPESVRDRPTRAHEYVFLLTKSARYFYDQDAIREPHVRLWDESNGGSLVTGWQTKTGGYGKMAGRQPGEPYPLPNPLGANARTVWQIATEPSPEAHFATFPTELARRCVLAGTKPGSLVLDPFAGSGTVILVADMLGRDAIGLELNATYVEMARRRVLAPRTEAEAERRAREEAGQMSVFDGGAP